jgi:hypothetical protein
VLKEYNMGDNVQRHDKPGTWLIFKRFSVNPGGPLTYYDVYELETSAPPETIHLSQIKPAEVETTPAYRMGDYVRVENEVGPHLVIGLAPHGQFIVMPVGGTEDFYINGDQLSPSDYVESDKGMTRESILDQAKSIVMQDRNLDYGSPEDNFRDIAQMWSTYRGHEFKAHDVAAMMIMVKLSRLKTSPAKEDHWVDIAGYAACGGQAVNK